jgi:prevent-host-death family protein
MREIGVRELKATLSEVLRQVAAGERVRVTVRGRPVADILPVATTEPDERLRALVTQRRLVPPRLSRPVCAPPLARAQRAASALVVAECAADP